ncbi:MAG: GH92 family glycosyl hydrolase, partial [Syntrophothermus sp.]
MNFRNTPLFFNFILIVLLTGSIIYPQRKQPADYVDPMIGTSAHGHTYPGASLPFGLVQLSPDTDRSGWDWCSGYHFSDSSIIGFSHTHLSGTGCADYGDILIMPTTGGLKMEPGDKTKPGSGYRSSFSHNNETAKAGYYSVLLDSYQIKAELTASLRAGFHRYTFLQEGKANIIIDLIHGIEDRTTDAQITFVNDFVVEGYRRSTGWANNHCVYFRAVFSKPFINAGITDSGKLLNDKNTAKGNQIKSFLTFDVKKNEKILIKVGISHTNIEGARLNVASEIRDWNFDRVRKEAAEEWNRQLSLINIESKDEAKKKVFYTALYHSFLSPNTFSDAGGSYTGMDGKVHKSENSAIYTVFSLWDTFRALNPLLTIVERERAQELVRTLISKYEESGLLPVWELAANETGTMIGYHSIPLIADAYFKGIRGFDVKKAYEAMKKSATQHHLGLDPYMQMGYIPADLEGESVSKTLEYAYDDWCIARMAKELGNDEDYKYYSGRALSYINVFDPSFRLMRPKKNGKWLEPFDPYSVSGNYTEANSWQYSFFVPQDVNNLIKLMGGDDAFISRLDDLFTADPKLTGRFQSDITGLIGQYAHGNEPSHHMAYLYNYAGAPWKTQQRVNQIVSTLYTDKPDGLCGNEDCGQMSAWYVLSAMGFYSVCPGDARYVIGTPAFDRTVIKTGKESFTIKAENLSEKNIYIQSAALNGKGYPYSYIDHSVLLKGGELV